MLNLSWIASEVPLAANAPSPGIIAGILSRGNSFQFFPSSVERIRNLPSMGSPSAKQCVPDTQTMSSRKKAGRLSVYCSSHVSPRSEEHTSELQSLRHLVCRL